MKQITDFDIEKLSMVRDLLGKAVHNASEHHTVINIKTAVMQRKIKMEEAIDDVAHM